MILHTMDWRRKELGFWHGADSIFYINPIYSSLRSVLSESYSFIYLEPGA